MNSPQLILIDAGTGNLHSVRNALEKAGGEVVVTKDPSLVRKGGRLILPGVGAFGRFMTGLRELELLDVVREVINRGDPFLGICVGMQAFFDMSEEMGEFEGLGCIPGRVVHFPDIPGLKVPHTGWNQLYRNKESNLLNGVKDRSFAYFNHSYYCAASESDDILAYTSYGIEYASMCEHENIYGVQFHPEKSQKIGQIILRNFITL